MSWRRGGKGREGGGGEEGRGGESRPVAGGEAVHSYLFEVVESVLGVEDLLVLGRLAHAALLGAKPNHRPEGGRGRGRGFNDRHISQQTRTQYERGMRQPTEQLDLHGSITLT